MPGKDGSLDLERANRSSGVAVKKQESTAPSAAVHTGITISRFTRGIDGKWHRQRQNQSDDSTSISVATTSYCISSILLAIVSQQLVFENGENNVRSSFEIGAQPPWNIRRITGDMIQSMFDEDDRNSLLSLYLKEDEIKEKEDSEFSLVPYACAEIGNRLEMPCGRDIDAPKWTKCSHESYSFMASILDGRPHMGKVFELKRDDSAIMVAAILRGISEQYNHLTKKEDLKRFVSRLFEMGKVESCSSTMQNARDVPDLILLAKSQWLALGLPCFAAIGGRRRLFTLCHAILGLKATDNGTRHVKLKGTPSQSLVCYPATVQIVLGDDADILQGWSDDLQTRATLAKPVTLGSFLIHVLKNQKRLEWSRLMKAGDLSKHEMLWQAARRALEQYECYKCLNLVPGRSKTFLDVAREKKKRGKTAWADLMNFVSEGRKILPYEEDGEPCQAIVSFLSSANSAFMFPELACAVAPAKCDRFRAVHEYLKDIADWVVETIFLFFNWRGVSSNAKPTSMHPILKTIFSHRVSSIQFQVLAAWGLEVEARDNSSVLPLVRHTRAKDDAQPIKEQGATVESNLFAYFRRMTLRLESGHDRFDHNFGEVQFARDNGIPPDAVKHTKLTNLMQCFDYTARDRAIPRAILVVGMTTLALPPFPFQAFKDESTFKSLQSSALGCSKVANWARLSAIQQHFKVHVFTMDLGSNNRDTSLHPHLHIMGSAQEKNSRENARKKLEEYFIQGFEDIYFEDSEASSLTSGTFGATIAGLSRLLQSGGAMYVPECLAVKLNDSQSYRHLVDANLKVDLLPSDSLDDHLLLKGTQITPRRLLAECNYVPSTTQWYKVSTAKDGEELGFKSEGGEIAFPGGDAADEERDGLEGEVGASDCSGESTCRETEERFHEGGEGGLDCSQALHFGSNDQQLADGEAAAIYPNPPNQLGQEMAMGIAASSQRPTTRRKRAVLPLNARRSHCSEIKVVSSVSRKRANGKSSQQQPNKSRKTRGKYIKPADSVFIRNRNGTRNANKSFEGTHSQLVPFSDFEIPHFFGLIISQIVFYGGLFTSGTLNMLQAVLASNWYANGDKISPLGMLSALNGYIGDFEKFHEKSFLQKNPAEPFNFMIVPPALIQGLVKVLKNHKKKFQSLETISKTTDEKDVSSKRGCGRYYMFSWHSGTRNLPDDWKSSWIKEGFPYFDAETMDLIDRLALSAARVIVPGCDQHSYEKLLHDFLVHPGIVETVEPYHQRLHYDRPNEDQGTTFYLHVPLTTDGMLLRILLPGAGRRPSKCEFIFVPFGCALAIPVSLAHAGIYSKTGSKILNRRLHIAVTKRSDLNLFPVSDTLNVAKEKENLDQEKFETAMNPSQDQQRFSKMYLKLMDGEGQNLCKNSFNLM